MMNNVEPNFQNRLDTIFARLNPTEVEEFYAAYQQWTLQQRINELRQRIDAVREQQKDNRQRIRETQPSAIALAALARLQSNGVSDIELLDAMLERGESWLDQTMQRLDYFEQFEDFVSDDYTQWCQGALEGAFDWIDSLREDTEQEAPLEASPEEILSHNEDAGDVEALLLQRLATEDEQDDLAWQEAITLKQTAIKPPAPETASSTPVEEPEQAVHEDATLPETGTALQITEYIPQDETISGDETQAGKDEGDRKGPLSTQPNPRLYYDDGSDSPGAFIVEAGADAKGGGDPRGRLRTTNVSGEEGEDTLMPEPEQPALVEFAPGEETVTDEDALYVVDEQPTLVEFASIEEPSTRAEEPLINDEQPALVESAPTGETSIDEIDEQPTIVEF
ncbi:MAG TPA: hypothetical protein VJO32_17435, partial [Ktedonobacteraceae bacterium]|nr:hypothetical protein [Ktedonobacteraceae bacterium]